MSIKQGYVYIHKLSNGEYEAVGYDWEGYVIVKPVYSLNYQKAYQKIYRQLK
jgi:hypothetical protein